jgi:hypothetical protein
MTIWRVTGRSTAFFAAWASRVKRQERFECCVYPGVKVCHRFSPRQANHKLRGVQEIEGASLAFFAKQQTVYFVQALIGVDRH